MDVEIVIASDLENGKRVVRANPMFRVGEFAKERGVWVFHHYSHADKLSPEEAKTLLARTKNECAVMNIRDRLKK